MPKKDKKDKKKKAGTRDAATAGAVEAVEAVRSAVERTFAATAESAQQLRGPAQEFAGEVAVAANRIREVLEDRVVDELKHLRVEIEGLARRVQALEVTEPSRAAAPRAKPKPATPAQAAAARRKRPPGRRARRRSPPAAARHHGEPDRDPRARDHDAQGGRDLDARQGHDRAQAGHDDAPDGAPAGGTTAAGDTPSSGAGGTTSGN